MMTADDLARWHDFRQWLEQYRRLYLVTDLEPEAEETGEVESPL